MGIPANAWPTYASEVLRVLKPGTGIAVFIELNPIVQSDDCELTDDMPLKYVHMMLILS